MRFCCYLAWETAKMDLAGVMFGWPFG